PARLRAAGLSSGAIASAEDLARLPVLDKAEINVDRAALDVPDPPRFRHGATSGSTGTPMRVRTPAEMDAAGRAARWRMLGWFGIPFGAPTLSFTGGNQPRGVRLSLTWRFAGDVLGQGFTDAFRTTFEQNRALLERIRPEVVIGYPNVLV